MCPMRAGRTPILGGGLKSYLGYHGECWTAGGNKLPRNCEKQIRGNAEIRETSCETERHVILRKERQRRFTEGRLKLWVIVEETALRRPMGNKEILRDQLRYLLSLSGKQNLTLQVIPAGVGGHAVPNGFTILRFAEPDLPDVAYLEHLTSALYFDKKADVDRYLLAMERLSIMSAKPSETPGILTTIISQLDEELGGR